MRNLLAFLAGAVAGIAGFLAFVALPVWWPPRIGGPSLRVEGLALDELHRAIAIADDYRPDWRKR